MTTRYDVSNLGTTSSRHTDLREAFDLAKKLAKVYGLATITKLDWNDNNRITDTKVCFVRPDGSFYY